MRKILKNKEADVRMIGMVVGLFITLLIAVLVLYNVVGSINYTDVDNKLDTALGDGNTQDTENASNALLTQSETFFTIAPIIGIVIVAVVILSYVGRIG